MSRLLCCWTCLALIVAAPGAMAQESGAQNPFELARALRENDQPDLALEYLDDLAKTLPKELLVTLPIERAKSRIKLAAQEADDLKRDTLVNEAKAELDQFLKANAGHPRSNEAAMSLANISSLQGKSQLERARKLSDVAGQKTAAALARPFFNEASTRFQKAAESLEQSVKDAATPNLKLSRSTELFQTILDQAVNRYYLGESYIAVEGKQNIEERAAAYKSAQDLFTKLGERDPNHSLCWVARAWVGECSYAMSETFKAEATFAKLRTDAAKIPNGPGTAGVRQARFFEIRDKWIQAGKANTAAAYSSVRKLCEVWVSDYRSFRITNENYAILYYTATTKFDEARLGVKVDPKTMVVTVNPAVIPLLKEADRELRRLADSENEYTTRATKMRPQVVRLIVGNADKKPEQILTFEECHLTSLVQLDKFQQLNKDDKTTPEEKKLQLDRVIALLEREKQLPVPKESLRDSQNSQVMLVYTYRLAGLPYQAAVLGEFLARTIKGPAAAKAGLNAILAYQEAAEKADSEDTISRQTDFGKAMSVVAFLDQSNPNDPTTDEVRYRGAQILVQNGRYLEAFQLLNRVTDRYSNVARARLLQGGIAFELLRPRSPNSSTPKFTVPSDAQKVPLFQTATTDLGRVPVATATSPANVAIDSCRVQFQLAQLYLASGATGYPVAEKISNDVTALIPTLATVQSDDKESLRCEAEIIRINAVYGQAMPLHQQKKYKESADRYKSLIAAMQKSGPAVKKDQAPALATVAKNLDALRISKIVVPSLNSRVGEGQLDEAGKLLDMLSKFGGDQNQTVNAVFQVVVAAKPQIEQMVKEGKADDAKKVSGNLSNLAARISGADAKLTPVQLLDLGKIFKELGDYDKGIALLLRVPAPKNLAFLKAEPPQPAAPDAAWTADKAATPFYRVAQLELIRTYRLANQLPKAEELLEASLGKDRKSGWAFKFPEYRREELYYLESKAAGIANPQEASKIWAEAKKGWDGMSREYLKVLTTALPANAKEEDVANLRRQKEFAKPIYYDLVAELIRCLTRAQLQINNGKKPELDKAMAGLAKQIVELEKKNPELNDDVKAKFLKLFEEVSQLKDAYKAAGGAWNTAVK